MDDVIFEVPEFSKAERLDMAYKAWSSDGNTTSIWKLAAMYGVLYATLHGRTKGAASKLESIQSKQLLSPAEEECLREWCIQRVISIEALEAKEQEERDKKFLAAWKEEFCTINLDVFIASKAKSPCKRLTRKKKEKAIEALVTPLRPLSLLDTSFSNNNLRALSPTKEKGKRKASEVESEPRKKLKVQPEIRSR